MNNKIPVLFFLGLFLISGIFAVEVEMNDEYLQGETLIAKISGNFLTPIGRSNIFFYREHVRVSFEYQIKKIGFDYYLYAFLVGKTAGNYSLSIEDARYSTGGVTDDSDIVKNFSLSNETTDFSVNPGFIDAVNNFSVTVKNLRDYSIDIDVSTSEFTEPVFVSSVDNKDSTIKLNPSETKKINFIVGETELTLHNILFSSENITYKIPASVSGMGDKISEPSEISDDKELDFQTSDLVLYIPTNFAYKQLVYLYNSNETELEDISLSLSDELAYYAVLSDDKIDAIEGKSNKSIELSFFSEEERNVEGYIYVTIDNKSSSLFISAKFVENSSDVETPSAKKTCAEQDSTVCNTETHTCEIDGEAVNVKEGKDGWCCPGVCSEIKTSNSGRIIAVILILLVIILLFWFYFKKYKKSKKPVDLLKVAKGK
ncbi:MAG: hypothetical protein WC511_04230 [Candidatus Pacearchaeota archaeon]|jgi:hypothetical protein